MKNGKKRERKLFLYMALGTLLVFPSICSLKAETWYLCPTDSTHGDCRATSRCACGVTRNNKNVWYGADQGGSNGTTRLWNYKRVGNFDLCGDEIKYCGSCAGPCSCEDSPCTPYFS